jgi:putative ABC transport system permease protein
MNWIKQLFSRRRLYSDLSEEIQEHLEEKTEELVASGLSHEEATTAARREFGNVTLIEERSRDVWQWPSIENFFMDVRYGLRMLAKNPGFTAVAVLALALGIGATTAMFSIVDGAFLKPLPVSDPGQFVRIWMQAAQGANFGVSFPDYLDLRAQCSSLSGVVAYERESRFVNSMDESSLVLVDAVSLNYFDVLGIKPLLGRTFPPEVGRSAPLGPTVVLSYTLWKNRLGGDPGIIGKTIRLNNQSTTVLGVARERFRGVERFVPTDAWLPLDASELKRRDSRDFDIVGRPRPGVTDEQIGAELDAIGHRLAQAYPATNKATTFRGEAASERQRGFLLVSLFLMSVVGLVLLISCANVAGLLLARGETRRREVAVRLALGSSRGRLIRQFLTEGLMLSLAGAALGLLLAAWLIVIEPSLLPPSPVQIGPDLRIDGRVMLFTLFVSLLATLIFGVAPALRASKADLARALKGEEASLARGSKRMTARNILVVGQVALSVLMLSVAGLFLKSLMSTLRAPLGLNLHKNLLVVPMGTMEGNEEQRRTLLPRVLERVRGLPGIVHATCAMRIPLSGSGGGADFRVSIPGIELPEGQQTVAVKFNAVGPDYFQTVGTRILKGRHFSSSDTANAPKVVLISETMARRFWPNQDPLGHSLRIEKKDYEIIGVVEDVKINQIHESPEPYMYFPFAQTRSYEGELIVETTGDPRRWIPAVKREIRAVDKTALVVWIQTGADVMRSEQDVYAQRAATGLVGSLSLLGMFLASVGLYGVVAYIATLRTHEIGIRVALGAGRKDILGLVLRQGLKLVAMGALIGLGVAFATTRFMSSLLYGVSPADPTALFGSTLLAGVVALVACYIPARRATMVHPMMALRHE